MKASPRRSLLSNRAPRICGKAPRKQVWIPGSTNMKTYNRPERSISYYNKGQILGVLLDLAIRDATDNHKSLDDVLRRMNDEYANQGKFYNESDGIRAVVEEVAGKSFEDFFRRYVAGADEIPYDDFFSVAGLALKKNASSYSISEMPNTNARQRRIREGILRGTTD